MEAKTIVCISCYYKGYDFMEEMKALGNRVILITSENLKDKNWPWNSIDEVFYMPEIAPSVWNLEHLVQGFSHLMRSRKIDAVVALDDYDVEKAAQIRETFRIPGMGQTTHRYFRDKLAMRQKAQETGISVPEFTAVFNDEEVADFCKKIPAPWVLKPRSEASASGIKKINSEEEIWPALENLGEERHLFLLESFKPGKVFHIDSVVYQEVVQFVCASEYLAPPMEVSHNGGVFRTRTLNSETGDGKKLIELNAQLLKNFKLKNGATHTEFIKGNDGKFYFLETASRVGGAHIPDLVESATGINIWKEWARVEDALLKRKTYRVPPSQKNFAGLLIALAKDKNPEIEPFKNEEFVKSLPIDYHIGIVYESKSEEKILQRLNEAGEKVTSEILNILPPKGKPTS